MEIWREIDGFPCYRISNKGNVKSLKTGKEIILTTIKNSRGYFVINLMKDGKMLQRLVHRLVAQAFIPNPENKLYINHIDLNKLNNHVENLEWVSPRENVVHYYSLQDSEYKCLGVSMSANSYITRAVFEKKYYHIGSFKTEEEACNAYYKALEVYKLDGIEGIKQFINDLYKDKFTSKYKGISYDKSRGKWMVRISKNRKTLFSKRFDTEEEALKSLIEKYNTLNIPLHNSHRM